MKRRVAFAIRGIRVGACAKQRCDPAGKIVRACSHVKRSPAFSIGTVRIGTCLKQQTDGGNGHPHRDGRRRGVGCQMQGCPAIPVPETGIPAPGKNCTEHVQGSGGCRGVHRRPAAGIGSVRTYTPGQQASHFLNAGFRLTGKRTQAAFFPRSLGERGDDSNATARKVAADRHFKRNRGAIHMAQAAGMVSNCPLYAVPPSPFNSVSDRGDCVRHRQPDMESVPEPCRFIYRQ